MTDPRVIPASTPSRPRRRRGGVFWPLVLIGVGVVLLLNNLRITDWDAWDIVVRAWPILIIATGLDLALERSGFFTPILLLAVGVAALLSTTEVWQWDMLALAARYWPVLLVAIGLDIGLTKPTSTASLLGVVPAILCIGALAWFLGGIGVGGMLSETRPISQPLPDVSSASVHIGPALGSLRVTALREEGALIAGAVALAEGQTVEESLTSSAGVATYVLSGGGSFGQPHSIVRGDNWHWDLMLTPDLPLDLSTEMVTGNTRLDLSGLEVESFDSDNVFGQAHVVLPSEGTLKGSISMVAGEVVVVVPTGMGVRLDAGHLIGAVDVPADFIRDGDSYESPNYASAGSRADIRVEQVVGHIQVRYELG